MSFVFFTQYEKKTKVGCAYCLDKANRRSLIKTVLLGWWGVPWGVINTIQSIVLNIKSQRTNHWDSHNNHLRNFTLSVIGELATYKENKEKLQEIIARENSL